MRAVEVEVAVAVMDGMVVVLMMVGMVSREDVAVMYGSETVI
jgi:hypothetical protein